MALYKKLAPVIVPCCFITLAMAGVEEVRAERPALINQCMECHGNEGKAAIEGWPPIAGQDKQILVRKLKAYRNQLVKESVMSRGVHDLTDQQIEAVASYFAALAPAEKTPAK